MNEPNDLSLEVFVCFEIHISKHKNVLLYVFVEPFFSFFKYNFPSCFV